MGARDARTIRQMPKKMAGGKQSQPTEDAHVTDSRAGGQGRDYLSLFVDSI